MNAVYTPSAAERTAGTVTLTLTTVGNGNCNAVSDQVTFTITPAPTANAGVDRTVCANNAVVTLNGSFTVATGGVWSGGAGSFDPSTTNMGAQYTPTAGEISSGSVTLTMTTTGNGGCIAVADQMVIAFTPAPVVNAGAAVSLCANNAQVSLSGSRDRCDRWHLEWWHGHLQPEQHHADRDLHTDRRGDRGRHVDAHVDQHGQRHLQPGREQQGDHVHAGSDRERWCERKRLHEQLRDHLERIRDRCDRRHLERWRRHVQPEQHHAQRDLHTDRCRAHGWNSDADLDLRWQRQLQCGKRSNVTYTITPAPTANAGADQSLCTNNPVASLGGGVTIATGGIWSGGAGTFAPSTTNLNATYTPTAAEIASGLVTLTLDHDRQRHLHRGDRSSAIELHAEPDRECRC